MQQKSLIHVSDMSTSKATFLLRLFMIFYAANVALLTLFMAIEWLFFVHSVRVYASATFNKLMEHEIRVSLGPSNALSAKPML